MLLNTFGNSVGFSCYTGRIQSLPALLNVSKEWIRSEAFRSFWKISTVKLLERDQYNLQLFLGYGLLTEYSSNMYFFRGFLISKARFHTFFFRAVLSITCISNHIRTSLFKTKVHIQNSQQESKGQAFAFSLVSTFPAKEISCVYSAYSSKPTFLII